MAVSVELVGNLGARARVDLPLEQRTPCNASRECVPDRFPLEQFLAKTGDGGVAGASSPRRVGLGLSDSDHPGRDGLE